MPANTTQAMVKSTRPASTDANGRINRGKYTLVSTAALSTRLLLDCVSANAKSCHGSKAENVKIGYGTPSDGTPASLPKKIVNAAMVRRGWRIAQAAPSAVCL